MRQGSDNQTGDSRMMSSGASRKRILIVDDEPVIRELCQRVLTEEGFKVDAIAPQASIYLTIQINLREMSTPEGKKLVTTEDATSFILDEAKIAVVPFNSFGSSSSASSTWYRLSVGTATMDDVAASITNLRNALRKLSL